MWSCVPMHVYACCIVAIVVNRQHTYYITQDGRTALYIATQEGHEDIVRLLLEAKADPDVQDEVLTFSMVFTIVRMNNLHQKPLVLLRNQWTQLTLLTPSLLHTWLCNIRVRRWHHSCAIHCTLHSCLWSHVWGVYWIFVRLVSDGSLLYQLLLFQVNYDCAIMEA